MKRAKRIPTIIVVLIMSLGLGLGVVFIQYKNIFKLRANPDIAPQNIKVTNVSDSSFSVSWTTDTQTLGTIDWGTSTSLGRLAIPSTTSPKDIHYITITELTPLTTYYFKINSGGDEFDNSGIPWEVSTGQKKASLNSFQISGTILTPGGQPAGNIIVSLTANGVPLSTLTSANGSWIISLSSVEVQDNSLVQIFANGGILGISSAQVYLSGVTLIPPIILGKTYDFRNLTKDNPNLPAVQLQFPNTATP